MDSPNKPLAKPMANSGETTLVKPAVLGVPSAVLSSLTVDTHGATMASTIAVNAS